MVEIHQGEIWWAELADPQGSGPGFRRPVVILQGESLNRSRISTVVCLPLTSNLKWADAPGSVLLTSADSGLPKDSVVNASQPVTLDRNQLVERCASLAPALLDQIVQGLAVVLGR